MECEDVESNSHKENSSPEKEPGFWSSSYMSMSMYIYSGGQKYSVVQRLCFTNEVSKTTSIL